MRKGLKFKNIHSNTFGLYMKSDNRQILPNSIDDYVYIPKKGYVLINSEIEDRFITVVFSFKEKSKENLRLKAIEIGEWLRSSQRERIEFDDEPGYYWMGKVSGSVDMSEVGKSGEFTVTFRCEPLPKTV